jgi:hypothetical protein
VPGTDLDSGDEAMDKTENKTKQKTKSLLSWSLYSSVSGKCACTMGLPFSEPTSEVGSHPKALTPFGSDISHLSANSSFLKPQHVLPKPLQAVFCAHGLYIPGFNQPHIENI